MLSFAFGNGRNCFNIYKEKEMRKCLVQTVVLNPQTGRFQNGPIKPALFHQWGIDYEHLVDITVQHSSGIVEFEDGTVAMFYPEKITFIKEEENA
jgi:hypothetical protein